MKNQQIKFTLTILLLTLSISSASAFTLVAQPQERLLYTYRISGDYYSLGTQVIVNTPYLTFYHKPDSFDTTVYRRVATVDIIKVTLLNTNATQPLIFRFYTYTTWLGYSLTEGYSLSNTSCTEVCQVSIVLNNPIILNDATSVAMGVYTADTSNSTLNQGWFIYGDKVISNFFNLPSYTDFLTTYPIVTDVSGNTINNTFIGYPIKYLNFKMYGTYLFPPTSLPTPPQTGSTPLPCLDCNGDTLPGNTGPGTNFTPDWGNLTYCPTCLGNETYNTTGIVKSSNGFCGTIKAFGYGTTEGCKATDFIDWLYDYSNIIFYISIILLVYKIYIVYNRG